MSRDGADFILNIVLTAADWRLIGNDLRQIVHSKLAQDASALFLKETDGISDYVSVKIPRKTTAWIAVLRTDLDFVLQSKAYAKRGQQSSGAWEKLYAVVSRERNKVERGPGAD